MCRGGGEGHARAMGGAWRIEENDRGAERAGKGPEIEIIIAEMRAERLGSEVKQAGRQ